MIKTLTLELLRDSWLIHEPVIQFYAPFASEVLAGKEISQGLFSSLELPEVPDNIALVTMSGVMTKADVCGSTGSRSLAKQMAAAAADNKIDAIILLSEDCPGGQANGVQEFADVVRMANTRKPVIGAVSGMACSAGYWPLTQCEEIYSLSETDLIGCIGVMARMKNPKKVDPESAEYIEVISDLSPDKNIEATDLNAKKQQIMNPIAKIFHDNVMQGRGNRLKLSKENVLSGKTYVARSATEFGMIDGIMPFNKIVARANFLSKKRKQK